MGYMMYKWETIDTAPTDGTEIIGCYKRQYEFENTSTVYGPWTMAFRKNRWMASFDGGSVIEAEGYWGTDFKSCPINPTHWTHMPNTDEIEA